MEMHTAIHPGELLREAMGEGTTVGEFAEHIGMTRENLQKVLTGKRSISPAMAVKLGQAFPNQNAALWLRLQAQYDLWLENKKLKGAKKIKPFRTATPLNVDAAVAA